MFSTTCVLIRGPGGVRAKKNMTDAKTSRRLALVAAGGEPLATGSPCADCGVPRTALNTGVFWSDSAKTRLTFHYSICDSCRSSRICKRLRDDPAAKLVQMGADAAARTKRAHYAGDPLSASACTDLIVTLLHSQSGRCASCKHEVVLAANSGIFMASLDKVEGRYDGSAQVLCFGCQRFFNELDTTKRSNLVSAVVEASTKPRSPPIAFIPIEFEKSVEAKLHQMKQRENTTDRPSRGACADLSISDALLSLQSCALRCT